MMKSPSCVGVYYDEVCISAVLYSSTKALDINQISPVLIPYDVDETITVTVMKHHENTGENQNENTDLLHFYPPLWIDDFSNEIK